MQKAGVQCVDCHMPKLKQRQSDTRAGIDGVQRILASVNSKRLNLT